MRFKVKDLTVSLSGSGVADEASTCTGVTVSGCIDSSLFLAHPAEPGRAGGLGILKSQLRQAMSRA